MTLYRCDCGPTNRDTITPGQKCLKCRKELERVVDSESIEQIARTGLESLLDKETIGGAAIGPNYKTLLPSIDKQVGGNHYKDMKIQPIQFIVENDIPYREANAIKYICRHKSKNGIEDIKKAIHYLEMIKEGYEVK